MEPAWLFINVVLLLGLLALAAGYFWQDRRCHLLRIVGSLLLATFFILEIFRIIDEGKDVWNVTFTSIAPPVFIFVAGNEYLSYRWDEDLPSLKWMVGTAWIAGSIYYSFDRIPHMTAAIVYVVAAQSIWFGQMFGYGAEFSVGRINWEGVPLSVSINEAPVNIILGCTGIEAIVIFVGAILATRMERDPWAVYRNPDIPKFLRLRSMSQKERMWRGLLYATSIVWVGNLIRNVLIIYLVDVKEWDFDFVHGDLAKTMSFFILLGLAFVTFNLMPEMLDSISDIAALRKRRSPEERARDAEEKAAHMDEDDGNGNGDDEDGASGSRGDEVPDPDEPGEDEVA